MLKFNLKNTLKKQVSKHGIADGQWNTNLKRAHKGIKRIEAKRKKHEVGFLDVAKNKTIVEEINEYAKKVKGKFENIIVVGIGGSSLGGQALFTALTPLNWNIRSKKERNNHPRLFFVDHMDSENISELVNTLDLKKTLFIVISKSGSTVEPMAIFFALEKILAKRIGKNWTNNIVTITDAKKGLLRDLSNKFKLTSFPVPNNIGGRFSALTAVGLLPMALIGIKIEKILAGALEAEKLWQKEKNNPIAELAAAQYLLDTKHNKVITVMFPYSKRLEKIGDWYVQLLAESIGKSEEVGPTPLTAVGPTDQHAQVQLFMEGPNNKFFIFIGVEKMEADFKIPKSKNMQHLEYLGGKSINQILAAEQKATTQALTTVKRPNATLTLSEVNEKTVGALLYALECQVAILGELYKINAFNQPGVELGKKLTKKHL